MAVPAERKRVAVVGSGVAGLSCAYLLARKHDVAIFEREKAVGMDAHSLDAHGARMDIPLRVFSESYYPNLTNLYNLVGIKYHVADYSFCCLAGGTKQAAAAYFRYVNFLWRGSAFPVPALFHPPQLVKCARLGAALIASGERVVLFTPEQLEDFGLYVQLRADHSYVVAGGRLWGPNDEEGDEEDEEEDDEEGEEGEEDDEDDEDDVEEDDLDDDEGDDEEWATSMPWKEAS